MRSNQRKYFGLLGAAVASVACLAYAPTVRAELLFSDSFSYPIGATLGSQPGWIMQSISGGNSDAIVNGLIFPGLASSDGAVKLHEQGDLHTFSAPLEGDFYTSFLISTSNTYSDDSWWNFAQVLFQQGWNQDGIVSAGLTGGYVGASGNGSFPYPDFQTPGHRGNTLLAADTTYLLVAYVDQTNHTISVWNVSDVATALSSGLSATPEASAIYTNTNPIGAVQLGNGWAKTPESAAIFDEIRIGTTLADVLPAPAAIVNGAVWNVDSDGSWQTAANWTTSDGTILPPNGAGIQATLPNVIGANRTITLDGDVTLGTLNIDSGSTYTIGGTGTLTLNNGAAAAAISVKSYRQIIAPAKVEFVTSTDITVDPLLTLTLAGTTAGVVVPTGSTVNLMGSGDVKVNGPLHNDGTVVITTPGGLTLDTVDGSGTVDLLSNPLLFKATSQTGVTTLINNGTISSSLIASSGNPSAYALGVITGADYTALYGTTYGGAVVAASDILVRYTYAGDANFDGMISGVDFAQLDAAYLSGLYGPGGTPATWIQGDFNHDGVIDPADFALIDAAFAYITSNGLPALARAQADALRFGSAFTSVYDAAMASAVPEPASLSLLAIGAGCLLGRRRR